MWTEKARSWRKTGKRAVSPIIATILLVAITVVLAAVLYILISGLTRGPGNTPIGSAFGAGAAKLEQPSTGTFAANGCQANDYCYLVPIVSASPGVTAASLNIQIRTTSGTTYTIGAGQGGASITNISGVVVVQSQHFAAGGAFAATSWSGMNGFTTTVQLSSTMNVWVDMGTTSPSGQGYTLVVLGVGSYSGQVTVSLP